MKKPHNVLIAVKVVTSGEGESSGRGEWCSAVLPRFTPLVKRSPANAT
nr:MAG TPA: hypothetical protein [Caudoviricetes sp.]